MKILWTHNFDSETISQRVVAENIQNEYEAKIMLNALQVACTEDGPDWYILVDDIAPVYKWEP